MKTYIIILLIVCSNSIRAQKALDTIYVNDKKNVALFFLKPIRQGITGSSNFVFTYNREKEQYFGLLQASPGKESNLLAITSDGQVYAYILKYKDRLSKLNYFIDEKESIGNEKPLTKIDVEHKETSHVLEANHLDYFKKYADFLLKRPDVILKSKRKKGMVLRIRKLVYNRSEVYVHMEIVNRSGIDFELDALNIFVVNGNKRRKSSYQKLLQEVKYAYKAPVIIKHNQSAGFVYVLPKFVLGNSQKLQFELQELNGDRNMRVNM